MNIKLPILIAAIIGVSILTINISVNSAIARSTDEGGYFGGMGYGGNGRYGGYGVYGAMGHGGTGPVIQEPVDTGNSHLDKAINKFYFLDNKISSLIIPNHETSICTKSDLVKMYAENYKQINNVR